MVIIGIAPLGFRSQHRLLQVPSHQRVPARVNVNHMETTGIALLVFPSLLLLQQPSLPMVMAVATKPVRHTAITGIAHPVCLNLIIHLLASLK